MCPRSVLEWLCQLLNQIQSIFNRNILQNGQALLGRDQTGQTLSDQFFVVVVYDTIVTEVAAYEKANLFEYLV